MPPPRRFEDLWARASRSPRKKLASLLPFGASVIDVGCGDFAKIFRYLWSSRRDLTVVGLERYDDGTIYGKDGIAREVAGNAHFNRLTCNIEEDRFPFPDASLDGAFCSHVLEHVSNQIHVIQEISRVVKPGGLIYIETPGPRSRLVKRGSARWWTDWPLNYNDDRTHQGDPPTLPSLTRKLREGGFDIVNCGYHRDFGLVGAPLYILLACLSLVPLVPRGIRFGAAGIAYWNVVGWPIYVLARRR